MSVAFTSGRRSEPTSQSIQALLDENTQLIQAIVDYQNKGKAYESTQYQQLLHRNLVYLATLADSSQTAPTSQGPNPPGASGQKGQGAGMPLHSQGAASGMGPSMGESGNQSTSQGPPAPNSSTDKIPNPMNSGGPSYSGLGPSSMSSFGPGTSSPPQLQHPPVSTPTHGPSANYPPSSGGQIRNPAAAGLGGQMGGMQPQNTMSRLPSQIPQQPMMPSGQQTPQQYMMQQRQMQYRQTSQQVPQQQPPIGQTPVSYGTPSGGGMMQGYPQPPPPPQQQQRYNMYRQPNPQQTLSHMPYPQQQNSQMMMSPQTSLGMGQMGMGGVQQSMGPAPMAGQSQMAGMVQSSMAPSQIVPSAMAQSPMVQSPMGSAHSPMVQSPMGQPPV